MYNTAPNYRPALPTRPSRRVLLGVSLVELLISLALGLVVLAGATGLFVGTIRSNAQLAASVDLNQDISSSMTLITNELRRAGYGREQNNGTPWKRDIPPVVDLPPEARLNIVTDDNDNHCVLFAYDRNDSGVIDTAEWGGFQVDNGELWMRFSCDNALVACSTSCVRDANNRWSQMLPPDRFTIDTFTIDTVGSKCNHAGTGSFWEVTEAGSIRFPCRQWFTSEDRSGTDAITGLRLFTLNSVGRHQVADTQALPPLCVDSGSFDAASAGAMPGQERFQNGVLETMRLNITLAATIAPDGNTTYQKNLRTTVKIRNEQIHSSDSPTEDACGPPPEDVNDPLYAACASGVTSSFTACN